jgi:hypothetical protein
MRPWQGSSRRIHDLRGRLAGDLDPENRGGRGPAFPGTNTLWAFCIGYAAMLNEILAAIGAIVIGGGGTVAIAFGLFKFFGEKWLNAKFEERLASFRHEQRKEIERLRFRINALMDRTAKLHKWEFQVLPEAWGRLNDAFTAICSLHASARSKPRQHPGGTAKRVSQQVPADKIGANAT